MDLGDFACLVKVVSPSMEEYDVAHLYMELVDSHGNVDADEWLLVLSLYEAVRHAYYALLPGGACDGLGRNDLDQHGETAFFVCALPCCLT